MTTLGLSSRGAPMAARPAAAQDRTSGLRGVWAVYRSELAKLALQVRVRSAIGLCLVGPFVFVVVERTQTTLPTDTPFGRWVHDSGFAVPLVILGFAGLWLVPALTSAVAGDIFACEDRFGTWKTILTRSRSRSQIFAGKTLAAMTYTTMVVLLLAASSVVASLLLVGNQPLVGLTGQSIAPGRAFALVLYAWATTLPPALGFTALALLVSVVTRSAPAGVGAPVVIGLGMQLYAMADGSDVVRMLLLTTPFTAWHGLLAATPYFGPLIWGAVTSLLYVTACLGLAHQVFRRRDIVAS